MGYRAVTRPTMIELAENASEIPDTTLLDRLPVSSRGIVRQALVRLFPWAEVFAVRGQVYACRPRGGQRFVLVVGRGGDWD
jgi:hypothetical protein